MRMLLASFDRLATALAVFSAVLLVLIVVGTGAEVFNRFFGFGLVPGIIDFSGHAMFSIALLSAPWLLINNGHIRVSMVVDHVPDRAAHAVDLIGMAICLVVLIALTYFGVEIFIKSYSLGEVLYEEIVIPDWWLQWQIPLSTGLMSIEFVRKIVVSVRAFMNGQHKRGGEEPVFDV